MKKALLKDSVKEIKNTDKRFISILLMAFLGVGFFAGIRVSSPDMIDTIDKYYKEQNVYDIQVISTLGLTEEDLEHLSQVEGVDKIDGSYEIDGKIEIDNKEIISKLITIGELNKPVLKEGSMPNHTNECLVEEAFLQANNKKIGDTIFVEVEPTTNDNGENIEYLNKYCEKDKLYKSGGSDYHGDNKPLISMAIGKGNLKIPTNIVKQWYKN